MFRALSSFLLVALVACGGSAESSASSSDALTDPLPDGAYETYAAFAQEYGGFTPTKGEVSVLGLRGVTTTGEQHATKFAHAFDDTFVVFGADGVTATRFAGSTHPFESSGVAGVPDVDGDGKEDVGMIKPGVYDVSARTQLIAGQPSYPVAQNGSGKLPGWRDTNHDGVISDEEMLASVKRKDGLTDVLFHQGEGGAPPAVGCQVFPASEMADFVRAIGGAKSHFRYVLVDVSMGELPALE